MDTEILNYDIDYDLESDIELNKEDYDKRFNERYEVLKSNVWVIKNIKSIASDRDIKEMITLWNVFGFLSLLSYDLISVGYNLYFEKNRWQKVYYSRQVALLLYEGLNDIPDLLGKGFKEIFASIADAEDYMNKLKEYKKELEVFKKEHFENLKNIRMNVGGHRDQDIDNQLTIIQQINPYEIIHIMTGFEKILRKITDHLQSLIVRSVKPQPE